LHIRSFQDHHGFRKVGWKKGREFTSSATKLMVEKDGRDKEVGFQKKHEAWCL
jgi:hypothetical protein